jgi:hypothetical protein
VRQAVERMRTGTGKGLAHSILSKTGEHLEAVLAIKKAAGVG